MSVGARVAATLAPLVAVPQFLTVVPVMSVGAPTAADLRRSLVFYPVIGSLVWFVAAIGTLGASRLWSEAVGAILGIAVVTVVTGGLHYDALMDTADGLFGGRTPERRLEIIRDSRIGSYGLLAGVLALWDSKHPCWPSCLTRLKIRPR